MKSEKRKILNKKYERWKTKNKTKNEKRKKKNEKRKTKNEKRKEKKGVRTLVYRLLLLALR